jgi:6-phosphofructo-2-kinase/fructose-2,6-biphosphatase 4
MARYLQWLGVKTRIFHLGDYRRATVGPEGAIPEDYFFPNASPASVILRQKILKKCREDIYSWLNHENGQVAIYDAVNPTASGRRSLAKEFAKHDVQVLELSIPSLDLLLIHLHRPCSSNRTWTTSVSSERMPEMSRSPRLM